MTSFQESRPITCRFRTQKAWFRAQWLRWAGVKAGTVHEIRLEPSSRSVKVAVKIGAGYVDSIRQDSTASISTHGVLGDKVVAISAGDPALPALPPGSSIPSEPVSTFSSLFGGKGDQLMDKMNDIAGHLDELLASATEKGKSRILMDNLISATKNISSATGMASKQLNGMKLKSAVDSLDSILAKMDHGNGTVSGLLNDPQIYDDTKALIGESNQNRIVRNLVRKSIKDAQDQEAARIEESKKQQAGTAGR